VAAKVSERRTRSFSGFLILRDRERKEPRATLRLTNPFDIGNALMLAVLIGVVMVLAKLASSTASAKGLLVLGVLSGIADVDAITLSMTRRRHDGAEPQCRRCHSDRGRGQHHCQGGDGHHHRRPQDRHRGRHTEPSGGGAAGLRGYSNPPYWPACPTAQAKHARDQWSKSRVKGPTTPVTACPRSGSSTGFHGASEKVSSRRMSAGFRGGKFTSRRCDKGGALQG
jgi:Domain of unknown function (DUF4010)